MQDDLVKRLRNGVLTKPFNEYALDETDETMKEAADRITALEAVLKELQDGWEKNEIKAGTWAKVRTLLKEGKG